MNIVDKVIGCVIVIGLISGLIGIGVTSYNEVKVAQQQTLK